MFDSIQASFFVPIHVMRSIAFRPRKSHFQPANEQHCAGLTHLPCS